MPAIIKRKKVETFNTSSTLLNLKPFEGYNPTPDFITEGIPKLSCINTWNLLNLSKANSFFMEINLSGQNILVTGASRGIGSAIAECLVSCGAKVAIHYQNSHEAAQNLQKKLGGKAQLFQADLSKGLEVTSLFNEVVQKFDHLDGIVNNAGIAISSPLQNDDVKWVDDWLKTVDVNLNATGLLCKKALNHFLHKKIAGRIVNISSRAAFRGDTADYMAYAASKAGMVAITKTIARAYGKNGIKAFVLAPGFTQTDMAQQFMNDYGEEYAKKDIALGQLTEPSDLAPMVAFLLSGLADHATGTTIDMNAGSYMH